MLIIRISLFLLLFTCGAMIPIYIMEGEPVFPKLFKTEFLPGGNKLESTLSINGSDFFLASDIDGDQDIKVNISGKLSKSIFGNIDMEILSLNVFQDEVEVLERNRQISIFSNLFKEYPIEFFFRVLHYINDPENSSNVKMKTVKEINSAFGGSVCFVDINDYISCFHYKKRQ